MTNQSILIQRADQARDVDDTPVNSSDNRNLNQVSHARRRVLKGGLGLLAGPFAASTLLSACASREGAPAAFRDSPRPAIGFKPVPVASDPGYDRVDVPEGYTARPFFSWGDPVESGAPEWRPDAQNTWTEQALQSGQNHDGMHFFPFPDAPNERGLLVINHEYINATIHPDGPTVTDDEQGRRVRPLDEVRKEQAGHGLSIIELRKDPRGDWQRVYPSRYNRRLTAYTPMTLSGPCAGAEAMKTVDDPQGRDVLGTLNNCSMGVTPWGTYLIAEENWKNYFVNRDTTDHAERREHHRYGIAAGANSHYNYWESADPRFDATPRADQPHGGYVNEPNRFGWVVEVDPFDPDAKPVKRTAFGRIVREGCTCVQHSDGTLAFYSGDDTRGEYVYKFVPEGRFDPRNPKANRDLLDKGRVYVAVYHDDGTGEWRPLVWGEPGLTAADGFRDQADVLINLRSAADAVGATPMDRPEWVAVNPFTRDGYVTLTNNTDRGVDPDQPVDAANPRPENHHGQILRWREENRHPAATAFRWELFLLAGEQPPAGESWKTDHQYGTIDGDIFASPDGLWFDPEGRLWIQTDFSDGKSVYDAMGTNQMLCADPVTRKVRRFLTGPSGCEITGITATPDGTAMWINVQHPGISYPASDGKTRPRSTTVLITKNDGGVIGT
ncbi:PhoX family phosphatase [Marinimicrobium sp. LS-A18]|uniref:PhoX family protein n=1 Tax=Marinimicrobium sp. LS-A18 TaxID=1381596 RepID=UPI001EE6C701|nr:PhoX family phosphatase [Marinimicrobium sp. LS-A18]